MKRSLLSEAEKKEHIGKRNEVEKCGTQVIETTEDVLRMIPEFIKEFNSCFKCYTIQEFIFNQVNYQFICVRETLEIFEVLSLFGLSIPEPSFDCYLL